METKPTEPAMLQSAETAAFAPNLTILKIAEDATDEVHQQAPTVEAIINALNLLKYIAFFRTKEPLQNFTEEEILSNDKLAGAGVEYRIMRTVLNQMNHLNLLSEDNLSTEELAIRLKTIRQHDVANVKPDGSVELRRSTILPPEEYSADFISQIDNVTETNAEALAQRAVSLIRANIQDMTNEVLGQDLQNWPGDSKRQELTIRTVEDVIKIKSKISFLHHEFGNKLGGHISRLSNPKTFPDIAASEEKKRQIDDAFAAIVRFLNYQDKVLIGEFPKEPLTLQQMNEIINSYLTSELAPAKFLVYTDIAKEDEQRIVKFYPEELILIALNIAQNQGRYNNKPNERHPKGSEGKMKVLFKVVSKENEEQPSAVQIIFRDNGPGFEIEEFEMGKSKGGGKGVGMAFHALIVQDGYEGQFYARNFRDPQTGEVLGAEVVLELPLVLE